MKYYIRRFFELSFCWLVFTIMVIYKAHASMPRAFQIFSITITLALLYWTHWARWLCVYWYAGSFIVFHFSARYRELYRTTLRMYEEIGL